MKKFSIFLLSALTLLWTAAPVHAEANPGQACPPGESRYRPGGNCERTTPSIPGNLEQYPLTCQDIPIAKLNGTSSVLVLLGATMRRNIISDITQAELGGMGPNAAAIGSYSADALAQIYIFNGLFDKPVSMKNESREAARTYWRLMNTYEQANAKAAYFDLVRNSQYINNISIEYYNPSKASVTPTPTPTGAPVTANDKLGINIGYGHTDPKFGADSVGRPVTFLVDLNTDEAGLHSYRDLYAGASMRIVRIKNFSASTPLSDFTTAGTRFSTVFGSDYVVLGNELNSIDVEYSCSTPLAECGSTYARQFAAFDITFTGPNLSAAPLNVGNPINDPVTFLSGARSAYLASTFLANNSYQSGGCVYDAIRCSKESYKWFSQFLGSSVPVILTEYGLAPPTLDRNLTDVITFYNTLPTDVLAVTPLIRNVCPKAKGEWLHFNRDNKLVDLDGAIVDPATCNATAGGTNPANDSIFVLTLANKLPACLSGYPVCKDFAKTYLDLSVTDRNAYDALLPFNFDNIRGYEVLNNIVYKENLPYVKAISDGLNNSRGGLLNMLSPQWINDLRAGSLRTNPNDPKNDPESTLVAVESALRDEIVNRARALNPNDCLNHDNSTYLPSPFTFPTNFDSSNVKLNQDVNITITSVSSQSTPDPVTGVIRTKYSWSGSTEGKPVVVINNPKLEDLSQSIKGPQSFTAMFLPGAGYVPNRDMVAPVAILSANNNDTKVEGKTFELGKARIARTAGESQTQLCELRNKWFIPSGLQKNNVNCVDPFQSLTTSVQGPGIILPIPTEANCDKTALPGNPGNLLPVESLLNIGFPSGADKNNVKNCYNDLVRKSNAAGYDPAFVMAIWLEESAASWYSTYPNSADFGCTVGGWQRMNFTDQITCFMNLRGAYKRRSTDCFTNGSTLSYQDFLLIFAEGNEGACKNTTGVCTLADGSTVPHYHNFCNNAQFPGRIQNYYSLVTGGKSLNLNASP